MTTEHPGILVSFLGDGTAMAASTVLVQLSEGDTATLKLMVADALATFSICIGGPNTEEGLPLTYQLHVCQRVARQLIPLLHCDLEIKEAPSET